MPRFQRYRRPAPEGSIVVRIVEADGQPYGFIREVQGNDEQDAYPTEQKPIDQVWRLLSNKLETNPDAAVFVETDANFEWRPEWGVLEQRA